MQQQLTRFDARVLFEGGAEVRDGRIPEHHRYFGNAEAFVVQEVFGVFHTLSLVKIEYGSAEDLFESFFQVTFVDGHLAAQGLDGNRFADML